MLSEIDFDSFNNFLIVKMEEAVSPNARLQSIRQGKEKNISEVVKSLFGIFEKTIPDV